MLSSFLLAFTSIFVSMDVIGAVPIYISLLKNMSPMERNKTINTSITVAFVVAVIFCMIGKLIFSGLGIDLPDFQVAGGLVLILISLADLVGGPHAETTSVSPSIGIVPLAMPLITGPGVLCASVVLAGSFGYTVTLLALVSNYTLSWIILRNCAIIQRAMGKDGILIMSKIAALLMAAIAVAMIRSGIFGIIHLEALTK